MKMSSSRPPQIRVLHVFFRNRIRFDNLPAFRAAISDIAGHEHILFHHHDGEGYLYRYPKIQYKISNGRPLLFCIDTGIEELTHFFGKTERLLKLDGLKQEIEVTSMRQHIFNLQIHKNTSKYTITNWLPLNQSNFIKYSSMISAKDKILLLEKILIGNILSFAKGVGWTVNEEITVNIMDFPSSRTVHVKNVSMQVFNAEFESNVFLPVYTGLGKLSSIGYGVVKKIK